MCKQPSRVAQKMEKDFRAVVAMPADIGFVLLHGGGNGVYGSRARRYGSAFVCFTDSPLMQRNITPFCLMLNVGILFLWRQHACSRFR